MLADGALGLGSVLFLDFSKGKNIRFRRFFKHARLLGYFYDFQSKILMVYVFNATLLPMLLSIEANHIYFFN